MPIIRFRGRVLPPGAYIVDAGPLTLLWPEPDKSGHMKFVVHIINSVVNVACDVKSYQVGDDIALPHIRAFELARSVVDCIAFVDGAGLTLVLEQFISPAGVVSALLSKNLLLPKYCTAFSKAPDASPENTVEAMWRMVIREPPLFLALNDLIAANTIPGQVAVNCGRAIEGLRRILVPNEPSRKQGWQEFQTCLNLGKEYIKLITDTSQGPRHGDRTDIPGHISQDIIERSWEVMNRFFEYRKRGNIALPLSEFPLLT
jgi:hypothetical protein